MTTIDELAERRAAGYGEAGPVDLDTVFHSSDEDDGSTEGATGATRYARAAVTITDADIRCKGDVPLRSGESKTCNKLLARQAGRPWVIECPRCHTVNRSPAETLPQSTP